MVFMKIKFSWIIYLLAVFVTVEVLVLKYLPVPDNIYGYLRFLVEVVIYFLGAIILWRSLSERKLPLGTNIDKPLLVFLGYTLLIIIINNAPFLEAFVGLRSLLRYVPLFYILAFVKMDRVFPGRYYNLIIYIALAQVVITVFQHYAGISEFWYPRASDLEIGGKRTEYRLLETGFGGGREHGAGIGTFGDSVPLALFLVIAFILIVARLQVGQMSRQRSIIYNVLVGVILISIFFTYSRGSVLMAVLCVPLLMFLSGKKRKLVLMLSIFILLAGPLLINLVAVKSGSDTYINPKFKYTDPLSNVITIFNSDYVDKTLQHSRGLVLTEVGSRLVETKSFFGYSPAQDFALDKAAKRMFGSDSPINNLGVINDVYWIAFIIYYGLAGLGIFLYLLYTIMKASIYVYRNTPYLYMQVFGLSMAALVVITIPYSMILRTFMFRSFGFFFWMIAGIVFAEWRRLRYNDNDMEL
jgi:hypothetical protein